MKILSREDVLKKDVLKVEKVDLGNGEYVCVRQMTGRERDRFEQSLMKEERGKRGAITYSRSLEDFRAKLAVNTLCDEEGNLLLESSDYEILSQNMSAAKLERIINKAQELNRITEEDREELVKNSVDVQSDDSTSA
jgi:hypothetical protein